MAAVHSALAVNGRGGRQSPRRGLRFRSAVAVVSGLAFATALQAADVEPDHFRGEVVSVSKTGLSLRTRSGTVVPLFFPATAKVYSLARADFEEIGLGSYVGSVAIRPDPRTHKPIRSLSLLHTVVELRILDEALRGIALGERKWDLQSDTVMAHGWVDDIEGRLLSIKYGPTDADETDVDIPLDAPITRMSIGARVLVKRGAFVFVGARRREDGRYEVEYLVVGKDGVVPAL